MAWPRRLFRLNRPIFGLLALFWPWFPASAQGPVSEPQLKAAFVLNFVRYVEWPEKVFPGKDAPITLCRIGSDDGEIALAPLDGRKVQERTLKIRFDVTVDAARSCNVVYVGENEVRRVPATVRSLAGLPVLTISDTEGFIDSGGAIGIVRGEQRLQFEINRSALDRAQLKASSQLFKLARAVISPGT